MRIVQALNLSEACAVDGTSGKLVGLGIESDDLSGDDVFERIPIQATSGTKHLDMLYIFTFLEHNQDPYPHVHHVASALTAKSILAQESIKVELKKHTILSEKMGSDEYGLFALHEFVKGHCLFAFCMLWNTKSYFLK